jgi:hypothetical protein
MLLEITSALMGMVEMFRHVIDKPHATVRTRKWLAYLLLGLFICSQSCSDPVAIGPRQKDESIYEVMGDLYLSGFKPMVVLIESIQEVESFRARTVYGVSVKASEIAVSAVVLDEISWPSSLRGSQIQFNCTVVDDDRLHRDPLQTMPKEESKYVAFLQQNIGGWYCANGTYTNMVVANVGAHVPIEVQSWGPVKRLCYYIIGSPVFLPKQYSLDKHLSNAVNFCSHVLTDSELHSLLTFYYVTASGRVKFLLCMYLRGVGDYSCTNEACSEVSLTGQDQFFCNLWKETRF